MELPKVQRTTLTMKEAAEYLGISYWLVNQFSEKKTDTMFKSWWKNIYLEYKH